MLRFGAFVSFAWCAAAAGLAQGRLYTVKPGEPFDKDFGNAVASLGDIDGDGYGELVIAARLNSRYGPAAGSVTVVSGRFGENVLHRWHGDTGWDYFGTAVANAGDVDGDGKDDVLVGAPGDAAKGPGTGSAYVFSGRGGGLIKKLPGDAPGDSFGTKVTAFGDVNDDGYPELGIASRLSVKVISTKDWAVLADIGSRGIAVVGPTGDMDADKVMDFAIGDGSKLVLYSGKSLKPIRGLQVTAHSMAPVGDVNRDGTPDLALGSVYSYGRLVLMSGKNGQTIRERQGTSRGSTFAMRIAPFVDADGDKNTDLLVTTRYSTSARIEVIATKDLLRVGNGLTAQRTDAPIRLVPDVSGDGLPEVLVGDKETATVWAPLCSDLCVRPPYVPWKGDIRATLILRPPTVHAGKLYLMLGSLSGTEPGIRLDHRTIPLNLDAYMRLMLFAPNTFLTPSVGFLNSSAVASARLGFPAAALPLLHKTMHHGYLVFGPFLRGVDYVSEAAPLTFVRE